MNQSYHYGVAEAKLQPQTLGLPCGPRDTNFRWHHSREDQRRRESCSGQQLNIHLINCYDSTEEGYSTEKPLPKIPRSQNIQSGGSSSFAGCVPFGSKNSNQGKPEIRSAKSDKRGYSIGRFVEQYRHDNQNDSTSDGRSSRESELKVKGWPSEPAKLKERDVNFIIVHIGECIMALLPVGFIVLCLLAVKLDRTSTNNNTLGHNVNFALQLGPTIFPILFAAVVSRTLKLIARLGAQRGSKLGTLEMLLASQNFFGALSSQILLRRITFVGLGLLILWSLSPLGGQASLRLFSTSDLLTTESVSIRYLDTGPASTNFGALVAGYTSAQLALVSTLYSALLVAPQAVKTSTMDTWGNVKIPRLEILNTTSANLEEWTSVPTLSSAESYSSLIGIPVVGLREGRANFSLEASYLSLQCHEPIKLPLTNESWKAHLGVVWGGSDPSNPWDDTIPSATGANLSTLASFFLDTNLSIQSEARVNSGLGLPTSTTNRPLDNTLLNATRDVIFASMTPSEESAQFMLMNCSVSETHVEAMVECKSSGDCRAQSLRRSQQNKIPGQFTPLDLAAVTTNLFKLLPWATGAQQQSGVSSPTELFLMDPDLPPSIFYSAQEDYIDLSTLSPSMLAARLGLVLNTFYQASLAPLAFSGGLPANLSLYGPNQIPINMSSLPPSEVNVIANAPMISRATVARQSQTSEIYVCKTLWASLLLVCSGILLLVGVAGIIIRMYNLVPDMLGFVSSMTYDHPFIPLPPGAGPLDGMERARVLKDLRVRIADVKGLDSIGHVALTAVSSRNSGIGPWTTRELDAKRRYG